MRPDASVGSLDLDTRDRLRHSCSGADFTRKIDRFAEPITDRKEILVRLVRECGPRLGDVRTNVLDEVTAALGIGTNQSKVEPCQVALDDGGRMRSAHRAPPCNVRSMAVRSVAHSRRKDVSARWPVADSR